MASKEPVRVLLTPAAGKFWLVHSPSADEALNGLKKKLMGGDFPLLEGVVATTDVVEACTGVNFAVVDVWKKGTEAKDFIPFYKSLASAIGEHAAAGCESRAVGDLEYANELFSESTMPVIDLAATRDPNLAYSERLNVPANRVENANICGNRPSTPYSDMNFATVKTPNGENSVHVFPAYGARKCSSAMSAGSSASDHIPYLENLFSMGEDSDGKYSSAMSAFNSFWDPIHDCKIGTPEDLGNPTPANFQSEDEGKIKQNEERLEMFSNRLKELENEAGAALHDYSSRIYELERHANRAFEDVCNKIEFLEREIANLESKLANAQVYLHGAFQEVAKWRQLYWNLRSRVIPSRG